MGKKSRKKRAEPGAGGPNTEAGTERAPAPAAPAAPRVEALVLAEERGPLALLALLLLALYAVTMPLTVTLEDSGGFIVVARELGIAHPPGYPTYTLLGALFTHVPLGPPAVRLHLLSALAAVAAAGALHLCARRLGLARPLALGAALLAGLGQTMWSQAIVAEVYTLHAAFFWCVLLLALEVEASGTPRSVRALAFAWGLSLTNHWPLMVLATPGLAVWLWPRRREILGQLGPALGLLLAGLSPYVWLLARSAIGETPVGIFGPIESLGEAWDYIARVQYKDMDASATAGLGDQLRYVGFFFRHLATEAGLLAAPLLVLGALRLRARVGGRRALALALALGSSSLLLLIFLVPDFDPLKNDHYVVYQVVPFTTAALVAAFGAEALGRFHPQAPAAALLAAAVVAAVSNFGPNAMRDDSSAWDHATAILDDLPPDAVLFVGTDSDIGQLSYAHRVAGRRPDVELYSEYGFLFPNRLFDQRKGELARAAAGIEGLLRRHGRLFATEPGPVFKRLRDRIDVTDRGLYKEITPKGTPGSGPGPDLVAAARRFLDRTEAGVYSEKWPFLREQIVARHCLVLVLAGQDHPLLDRHLGCVEARAQRAETEGRRAEAATLYRRVIEGLPAARKQRWEQLYNGYFVSTAPELDADPAPFESKRPRYDALVRWVWPGVERYPACDNRLVANLLRLRGVRPVGVDVEALRRDFGHCPNLAPLFRAAR